MEEELEGELEGELRSMQQAQEFMIRKGDESVIYGPLYRFSALLSVMRNGCCGWRVRARLSSSPPGDDTSLVFISVPSFTTLARAPTIAVHAEPQSVFRSNANHACTHTTFLSSCRDTRLIVHSKCKCPLRFLSQVNFESSFQKTKYSRIIFVIFDTITLYHSWLERSVRHIINC